MASVCFLHVCVQNAYGLADAHSLYRNGWLSILGWWLASGAACNFIASLILSIVVLWYPNYEIQNWQQWFVYIGVVWLAVALNTWGSQLLPLYNRFNCEQYTSYSLEN
jgi:choline transport protein